uniref:Uncharacterized protein n=1 Tax=Anguilla anguilla TaxID=7936 RepID=A0A0E9VKN9_ANGAN
MPEMFCHLQSIHEPKVWNFTHTVPLQRPLQVKYEHSNARIPYLYFTSHRSHSLTAQPVTYVHRTVDTVLQGD